MSTAMCLLIAQTSAPVMLLIRTNANRIDNWQNVEATGGVSI
jgi:hypothetical protein